MVHLKYVAETILCKILALYCNLHCNCILVCMVAMCLQDSYMPILMEELSDLKERFPRA